jgi:hypothetical protein
LTARADVTHADSPGREDTPRDTLPSNATDYRVDLYDLHAVLEIDPPSFSENSRRTGENS